MEEQKRGPGRPPKQKPDDTVTDAPAGADITIPPADTVSDKPDEKIPSANAEYNPLTTEPVAEKAYGKPQENAGDNPPPIPEPIFAPPPPPPAAGTTQPPLTSTPLNPEMKDLPPDEKQKAAEHLADAILGGYEMLHKGARWYVQVSEGKITDMAVAGEIAPDFKIPLNESGSKVITFAEYIRNYNNQTAEALTVSDAFKEDVRPVLTRVLMKYGWGMTDEQYLMYAFGEDLLIKGSMIVSFKKSMNQTLANLSAYYKQSHHRPPNNAAGAAPPPPQDPQPNGPAGADAETVPFVEVLEKDEK